LQTRLRVPDCLAIQEAEAERLGPEREPVKTDDRCA
jgi:hypothetical protein